MKKMIRRLIASLAVLAVILSYAQIKNIAGDVFNEVKGYIPENVEDINFDNLESSAESYVSEQASILVPSQHYSTRLFVESQVSTIEGKATTTDELLNYISPLMFYEKSSINLDTSELPYEYIWDLDDWPEGGTYTNWEFSELFFPGNFYIESEYGWTEEDENGDYDEISYKIYRVHSSSQSQDEKLMQRCKELASNVSGSTNQEKINSIVDLLNTIGHYDKNSTNAYDLIFNGKGNCNAYHDAVDYIARYLGIPCVQVSNMSKVHGWNIFIGSDGQIYEVDASAPLYCVPVGSSSNYFSIDYYDAELKLLEYDRKMLELHGNVQLPPPTQITPTPTPEVPEDNPKPEETEPTPSPTEEVTPTPAPQEEEVTPTPVPSKEPTEEKPVKEQPSEGNDDKPSVPSDAQPAPQPAPAETPTGSGIGTPVIVSIDSGTGTMTVVTQPVSGCKYEVRYMREGSNWMSYKTNKDTFISRGLHSGTTYYVQARLIKGNQYSDWTSSYSITIK